MRSLRVAALAVAAVALAAAAPAAAEVPVPRLAARVTDQTGTLGAAQRDALEAKLAAFEAKKGSQIAVLIVPSTQPEAIEQFSIRVVEAWKLGRARVDDGALLIVAKNDKRLRIEVGRGLEGAIPDAAARRVIAEYIAPHFKQGDFNAGIHAGIDRLIALVEGEPLPAPPESWQGAGTDDVEQWIHVLFIAGVVLLAINAVLRVFLGRVGAAALAGGAFGIVVWVVLSVMLYAAIAAVVAFLFALGTGGGGRGWSSRGGGWSSGGWSSGGGGGGFSGGGGSFGGGGSSGSW